MPLPHTAVEASKHSASKEPTYKEHPKSKVAISCKSAKRLTSGQTKASTSPFDAEYSRYGLPAASRKEPVVCPGPIGSHGIHNIVASRTSWRTLCLHVVWRAPVMTKFCRERRRWTRRENDGKRKRKREDERTRGREDENERKKENRGDGGGRRKKLETTRDNNTGTEIQKEIDRE